MDEVCVTSVKLSLSVYTNQSTCQVSSYQVHLSLYGTMIQPSSKNSESLHYEFNGLAVNRRYRIQVTYTYTGTANTVTVLRGYVNTLAPLGKFP